MNPILSREIRGRFRDKRSFWLLFGLSALLCLTATLLYASATSFQDYSLGLSSAQTTSRSGRELFRFLALGNTLAWLLIAPALTATGLAKERERGLLESLWLSPFRVRSQIWGRLGAALCFLLVLQIAILPIYGIAALLGGVSLFDIAASGLIIAMSALVTASFGLFCSARSYRGSSALGAAFLGVTLWSVAVLLQGAYWSIARSDFLIFLSHPVALIYLLLSPDQLFLTTRSLKPISIPEALLYGLSIQFLASSGLLWAATRKASKPLPDMQWSQGNRRLKKWRDELSAAKIQRQQRREAERAGQKVAGALLYEVPVEKWVRFKDPLLSREVRARFRLRQSGTLVSLLRFATFLLALGFWLYIAFNAFDPASRRDAGQSLVLGIWAFGTLAVGVMSSGALVREREAGTWEGLHLSLLSPFEIARSKWLSPLITLGYWSAPIWILLPFCWSAAMPGALIVVAASLSSVSAWGFWISSRAPHSAAATSWTLLTLLVALVAFPALDEILGIGRLVAERFYGAAQFSPYDYNYGQQWQSFQAIWNSYHPLISLNNLFSPPNTAGETHGWIVAGNVIFNGLITTGLLWSVWRRLKRSEK